MFRPARSVMIAIACGFLLGLHQSSATVVMTNEDFNTWTTGTGYSNYYFAGWTGLSMRLGSAAYGSPQASPHAARRSAGVPHPSA